MTRESGGHHDLFFSPLTTLGKSISHETAGAKVEAADHYFLGNSQLYGDNDPVNEAKWFYKKLLALGFDKTTVCVVDVEDPKALQKHVTHDVNLFLK